MDSQPGKSKPKKLPVSGLLNLSSRLTTVTQWALLLFAGHQAGQLNIPDSVAGPGDYAAYLWPSYVAAGLAAVRGGLRMAAGKLSQMLPSISPSVTGVSGDAAAAATATTSPAVLTIETTDVRITAELRGDAASDPDGLGKVGAMLEHFAKRGA